MTDEKVPRRNFKRIATFVAGIVLIPIFAFQAMKERIANENKLGGENSIVIDDRLPEFKLITGKNEPSEIQFLNGKRLPIDGRGLAVITKTDFDKNQSRFGNTATLLKADDFPVLLSFNSSGFDATGDPMTVRRVADGSIVFELKDRPALVRFLLPQRDGTFRLVFWDATEKIVDEKTWYRDYVGLDVQDTKPEVATKDLPQGVEISVARFLLRVDYPAGKVLVIPGTDLSKPASATVDIAGGSIEGSRAKISLSEGTYTFVFESEGKRYVRLMNGDTASVTILPKQWQQLNLTIRE